jgi:ABC-type multidrug transport system ATPase subunit
MATASPAIRVDGLRKSYRELPVLKGVDFEVARGSIFALLGSNGAGKTTVVRILSTLLKPDGGTARIEVWNEIQNLAGGGTTVLLTTQHLEEAEKLADRIAILHKGTIIVSGTLADLRKLLPPARVEYVERQPTLEDVFLSVVGKQA